jgi:hypothetical protein
MFGQNKAHREQARQVVHRARGGSALTTANVSLPRAFLPPVFDRPNYAQRIHTGTTSVAHDCEMHNAVMFLSPSTCRALIRHAKLHRQHRIAQQLSESDSAELTGTPIMMKRRIFAFKACQVGAKHLHLPVSALRTTMERALALTYGRSPLTHSPGGPQKGCSRDAKPAVEGASRGPHACDVRLCSQSAPPGIRQGGKGAILGVSCARFLRGRL